MEDKKEPNKPFEETVVDEVIYNGLLDYYCIHPEQKPRGFGQGAENTPSPPPSASPFPAADYKNEEFLEKRYMEKPLHEIENDLINEVISNALDEYRINHPEHP